MIMKHGILPSGNDHGLSQGNIVPGITVSPDKPLITQMVESTLVGVTYQKHDYR